MRERVVTAHAGSSSGHEVPEPPLVGMLVVLQLPAPWTQVLARYNSDSSRVLCLGNTKAVRGTRGLTEWDLG